MLLTQKQLCEQGLTSAAMVSERSLFLPVLSVHSQALLRDSKELQLVEKAPTKQRKQVLRLQESPFTPASWEVGVSVCMSSLLCSLDQRDSIKTFLWHLDAHVEQNRINVG